MRIAASLVNGVKERLLAHACSNLSVSGGSPTPTPRDTDIANESVVDLSEQRLTGSAIH